MKEITTYQVNPTNIKKVHESVIGRWRPWYILITMANKKTDDKKAKKNVWAVTDTTLPFSQSYSEYEIVAVFEKETDAVDFAIEKNTESAKNAGYKGARAYDKFCSDAREESEKTEGASFFEVKCVPYFS